MPYPILRRPGWISPDGADGLVRTHPDRTLSEGLRAPWRTAWMMISASVAS
jgi:hypothetical protein